MSRQSLCTSRAHGRRDAPLVLAGALVTGASSTLMHLAGTSGPTVAFFRCLYALPVLAVLALREMRRGGPPAWSDLCIGGLAGVFLAVDLVLWFDAIQDVGAGLATVVQDTQVVFVVGGTWLLHGTKPSRRLLVLIPVLLGGICLISGALGSTPQAAPVAGTVLGLVSALAYAGFLLLMGWRPQHRRRGNASFLTAVTVAAAATATVVGAAGSGIRFQPAWPSTGWLVLLALSTQVIGWLVISSAMIRATTVQASIALLLQPVAAVFFAWAILGEMPAPVQLAGVATVIMATASAVVQRGREPDRALHAALAGPVGPEGSDMAASPHGA